MNPRRNASLNDRASPSFHCRNLIFGRRCSPFANERRWFGGVDPTDPGKSFRKRFKVSIDRVAHPVRYRQRAGFYEYEFIGVQHNRDPGGDRIGCDIPTRRQQGNWYLAICFRSRLMANKERPGSQQNDLRFRGFDRPPFRQSRLRQQAGEKLRVEVHRGNGEAMCKLVTQLVSLIPITNEVGSLAAAGDEKAR